MAHSLYFISQLLQIGHLVRDLADLLNLLQVGLRGEVYVSGPLRICNYDLIRELFSLQR